MSKKPKRGVPAIDMTAMVDVAFLLLTFFILTTTSFREEQKLEVDMPSSHVDDEVQQDGLMIITVGASPEAGLNPEPEDIQLFVSYTDVGTREKVLLQMQEQLNTDYPELDFSITPEGLAWFTSTTEFGVPILDIPEWLNSSYTAREEWKMEGISPAVTDSTRIQVVNDKVYVQDYLYDGNDLEELIYWGRRADLKMRFAIKADGAVPYPVIAQVISCLQEHNVNTFSLITDLEEGGLIEE